MQYCKSCHTCQLVGKSNARFTGPYVVDQRLNETAYVISTPDHRYIKHVCHTNMLKAYVERSSPKGESVSPTSPKEVVKPMTALVSLPSIEVEEEEFKVDSSQQTARLGNSEMLTQLESLLAQIDEDQSSDMWILVHKYLELFNDISTQTTVLQNDIEVRGATPIKQRAYRVNSTKREVMSRDEAYLLRMDLLALLTVLGARLAS